MISGSVKMKYSDFNPRRTPSASIRWRPETARAPGSRNLPFDRDATHKRCRERSARSETPSAAARSAARSCSAREPMPAHRAGAAQRRAGRAVCSGGGVRIRKGQHFFQRIEHRDHIAGVVFEIEREQRDTCAGRHRQHRSQRLGRADAPDRGIGDHACADQDQQRHLIDAEAAEQQRMEMRGVEQGAVEAGGDQRPRGPCRRNRRDGSAIAPQASPTADCARTRRLRLPALPNGRISSGSAPISRIACTLFSRPSTHKRRRQPPSRAGARRWRGVRSRSGSSAQR